MIAAWPALVPVHWAQVYRLVLAKYPPIPLFERISDPRDWEELLAIESLTDPTTRQAVGQIDLVPVSQRLSGPGASWIMAAFTHPNPRGSRFSDGSYGVYYAADTLTTALAETIYHREVFHRDAGDGIVVDNLRLLVNNLRGELHDIRRRHVAETVLVAYPELYSPTDYRDGQRLAAALRRRDSHGVVYDSVRHIGGTCAAVFNPRCLEIPENPNRFLAYHWSGTEIDGYFDYQANVWCWKSFAHWPLR